MYYYLGLLKFFLKWLIYFEPFILMFWEKKTLELILSLLGDLTKKKCNNYMKQKITLIPCKPVRVFIGLFAQLTIYLVSEGWAINPNWQYLICMVHLVAKTTYCSHICTNICYTLLLLFDCEYVCLTNLCIGS